MSDVELLFSESSGRFVVQAAVGADADLVARLAGLTPVFALGAVEQAGSDQAEPTLLVRRGADELLSIPLRDVRAAFRAPFPPAMEGP